MDKLLKMLGQIKELAKSLKPGTVAGGRNMPSISAATPTIKKPVAPGKMPGIRPPSKVNPVKSAEQTQNKDVKDIKIKEAQQALKIKPMTKSEEIKFSPNGQWTIE